MAPAKKNLFAVVSLVLAELSCFASLPRPASSLRTTSTMMSMRTSKDDGGDLPPVRHVVVAGAGVIGISTAYYLAKDFGVATTLIDPTGTIAPAASGKAGGFLALDWNDHSQALGPLTRRSFALHQEIANELGADKIQYRRLTCVTIPVGKNNSRRPPSGFGCDGKRQSRIQLSIRRRLKLLPLA